ncbi:MAG: DUF1631 family protein [Arenimonas sp.]
MDKTRAQALKELRSLLSEVLSTAVASTDVPEAFKSVRNWDRLIAQTETRFTEAWRQRFAAGVKREQHAVLCLLPEDEQDQQILTERFVNEVLDENREPLDDLDQQLAAMSGVQPDETRENPLGPSAWAEGIRTGVRELDCSPDDRDWLMEQVMPLLADRVGQFYSTMSTQLTSVGFAGSRRSRAKAGTAATPAKEIASGAGGFSPDLVEARQPAAHGHSGGADSADDGATLDHLLGMLSAQRAPAGQSFPAGDAGFSAGFDPASAWSQADVLSVLAVLQNSYTRGADSGENASVGNLQQAIASTGSKLGLAGGAQAMPGPAQDTLALVSMLFDVMLEGRRLDEAARLQLSRLTIPYIRVAMIDRRLFMQAHHPARRVLNLLVEAFETAAADVAQYNALRESALRAVDRIVSEFSEDIEVFAALEKSLASELEACRRRTELAERRAAEAQNGRERREHARDSVARFLSAALTGKRLPAVLRDFLMGPWQHHQNLALLNEGDDAAEVATNQLLLSDLIEASANGAIADPTSMLPRVAEVLQSSGQPAEAASELLKQLSVAFTSKAFLPAVEASVVESTQPLVAGTGHVAAGPPPPADLVAKYTQAPLGTWLDFVGEDGRISSAKISWTSPISGRRILSNRRGQRILVASAEELADMELSGRIRPRQSESAFDQALHTVTRRLEVAAVAAAA